MKLVVAALVLFFAYLFQKGLYRRYWNQKLLVTLKFNKDYIECKESAELMEIISNDKFLPLPVMHVKLAMDRSFLFQDMDNAVVTDYYHRNDAFSILGHQRVTRRLAFQGTKRGFYHIGGANILVKDFFLTSSFARTVQSDAALYVFPEKLNLSALELRYQGMLGELAARKSLVYDTATFRGIRDYQRFDSYRSINWKASARANGLKVNVYDYSMDAEVRILLNLDTDSMIETNRLLEDSISLASTLARQFLRDKIRVSLWSTGLDCESRKPAQVMAGGDLAHGITIDQCLARIKGSAGKDAFLTRLNQELEQGREEVLYVIISPYHKEDLTLLLDQMTRKGMGVHMLVPYYDTLGFLPERSYMTGWEVSIYEN